MLQPAEHDLFSLRRAALPRGGANAQDITHPACLCVLIVIKLSFTTTSKNKASRSTETTTAPGTSSTPTATKSSDRSASDVFVRGLPRLGHALLDQLGNFWPVDRLAVEQRFSESSDCPHSIYCLAYSHDVASFYFGASRLLAFAAIYTATANFSHCCWYAYMWLKQRR